LTVPLPHVVTDEVYGAPSLSRGNAGFLHE